MSGLSGWLTDLILSDCQSTTLIMLERLEAPSLRSLHPLTRLSAQKASLHDRYRSFTDHKSFLALSPLTRERQIYVCMCAGWVLIEGASIFHFTHPTFLISPSPSTSNHLSVPLTPAPGSGGWGYRGHCREPGIACWLQVE